MAHDRTPLVLPEAPADFGRGMDNRHLQAAGFRYGHTSCEAVAKFGHYLRVDPVMRGVEADHEPLGI